MTLPAVLVVDPNPATHRRVAEAFEGTAWAVVAARDLSQASALVGQHSLSLVLAAASLPGGNGYDFARDLLVEQPAAAVLLMTGGYEVYNTGRAHAAGVAGHLAKPFSADGLREVAEEVVGPVPLHVPPAEPAPAPAAAVVEADEAPAQDQPTLPPPSMDPPLSAERVATILPRTYEDLPLVAVDPEVVSPAIERAILEVLPEVVEAVLRQALTSSPAFRDLVSVAVEEAVTVQLPAIAARVVDTRLAEIEAADG